MSTVSRGIKVSRIGNLFGLVGITICNIEHMDITYAGCLYAQRPDYKRLIRVVGNPFKYFGTVKFYLKPNFKSYCIEINSTIKMSKWISRFGLGTVIVYDIQNTDYIPIYSSRKTAITLDVFQLMFDGWGGTDIFVLPYDAVI